MHHYEKKMDIWIQILYKVIFKLLIHDMSILVFVMAQHQMGNMS